MGGESEIAKKNVIWYLNVSCRYLPSAIGGSIVDAFNAVAKIPEKNKTCTTKNCDIFIIFIKFLMTGSKIVETTSNEVDWLKVQQWAKLHF